MLRHVKVTKAAEPPVQLMVLFILPKELGDLGYICTWLLYANIIISFGTKFFPADQTSHPPCTRQVTKSVSNLKHPERPHIWLAKAVFTLDKQTSNDACSHDTPEYFQFTGFSASLYGFWSVTINNLVTTRSPGKQPTFLLMCFCWIFSPWRAELCVEQRKHSHSQFKLLTFTSLHGFY